MGDTESTRGEEHHCLCSGSLLPLQHQGSRACTGKLSCRSLVCLVALSTGAFRTSFISLPFPRGGSCSTVQPRGPPIHSVSHSLAGRELQELQTPLSQSFPASESKDGKCNFEKEIILCETEGVHGL